MRVIYLHQYLATPQSSGGTRSYEFARRLIAQGHEVRVITSAAYLPDEYKTLTKTTHTAIDGIPITVIPVAYSNKMSFRVRIFAFFRFAIMASFYATRHRGDVIYATSTPLTIAIPAIIGRVWHRIPMVFEVRDLWPELPIAVGALKHPVLRWLAHALEWVAYHSATHLIALSPGMKEGIVERGIAPERITVIPNACDVDRFDVRRPEPDHVREKLGLSAERPLVVYTGTFGLINSVDYVVKLAEAMRKIAPEVHFLLVGDGAEFEQVNEQARERGVLDVNLSIWKSIPKTDVPSVLATATAAMSVFAPIRPMWNNSANKVFDALAAGKPIIINYGGWQAEFLERTGAGLAIPWDNPQVGAEMVAALLHDSQRVLAARQAARALAYGDFNRDRLASQVENVLLNSLNKKSQRVGYWLKRPLDLLIAATGTLILLPLLVLLIIIVYARIGTPVFFTQQRPGVQGKPFTIYKFRTMNNERDVDGNLLPDADRITGLGQFLRRTSLDELPELFNVLKGDMSLVGPRPLLMRYLDRYSPEQARRHHVRPGITGWAQIQGRNALSWEDKFEMDVWYVDHMSLWLDIKILAITAWKVLRQEGISQEGYFSSPEFLGTQSERTKNANH